MNFFDLSKRGGHFAGWNIGPYVAGIRPEDLQPVTNGKLTGKLERVEYLGVETLLHLRLEDGAPLRSLVAKGYAPPAAGSDVGLDVPVEHLHLFDPQTGSRIPERQLKAVV
ncbi:MAG: TOBE domain-containing protein [Hyphomicrobiales bacterium]|nr:TOBE domain-containing protein [Hyphomicrobiales bacterium]